MSVKILDSVRIPIRLIHPNEWNPNEQSDEVFNMLSEEIAEDGFGNPLGVVHCTCEFIDEPHYKIIEGDHRYRIARIHSMTELPCFVYTDWDETQQKLKTVRRNLLTGDLNPTKFTALVKALEDKVDPSVLVRSLGFADQKEFDKYFIKERDTRDRSFIDGLVEETKREKFAVDSLTDIIASIFADAKVTLDQNYLFFAYKGKMQMALLCDDTTWKSVLRMIEHLKATGRTATEFIAEAIEARL